MGLGISNWKKPYPMSYNLLPFYWYFTQ